MNKTPKKRTAAGRTGQRTGKTGKAGKTGKNKSTAPANPKRGDRSKRLLDLVMLLLRTRTPVTFRQIREQFVGYKTANVEAGLRAFERDKADLLELGVPVRYVTPEEDDALEEGGYVIDLKRYRLPEVHLTADEISALVLATSVARAVPGGATPKIVDLALKKLAFDMPEPPDTPTAWPPAATREPVLVHFPESKSAQARELSDRFAQLESATRNRKRVTVCYQNATGQANTRDIDPYSLIYHQSRWVLVGHCHLRDQVRSFRVDRMSDLKIAPRPKSPDFERPESFDARVYVSRSPWTFETDQAEDVILRILPDAADVTNEDFGASAQRTTHDDGPVDIRFACTNLDFAVSKILGAGGGIVLIQGDRLREHLTAELEAIASHYRGSVAGPDDIEPDCAREAENGDPQ